LAPTCGPWKNAEAGTREHTAAIRFPGLIQRTAEKSGRRVVVLYELNGKTERHYQVIFYVVFTLMGQYTAVEVRSTAGRAERYTCSSLRLPAAGR
jgi:hypothetical protein